jgi:endonuclease YncB( thermonuclease family)
MSALRPPRPIRTLASLAVLILALAAYAASSDLVPRTDAPSLEAPAGVPGAAQQALVERVVDGDTIWVTVGSPKARQKIRILEIDAPEINLPSGGIECSGLEATDFARRELKVGSSVHLLADREDKDQYGRYLRYVWDEDGELYNEKVVRLGYAKAVLFRPNDLYISRIRAAEFEARLAKRGIWGPSCLSPK